MSDKVLIMRSCDKDLRAYGEFQWPESGPVSAPDWEPTEECGAGLHGFLWGEGDYGLANLGSDAKWLVVEVDGATVINLGGKVKFPAGVVIYCGDARGAAEYILANGGVGKRVMFGTATAGYKGTATAGYKGTATAGDEGTATAGDEGTATAGYKGTATAGYKGTATAGDEGTATAGYKGTATAGDEGTATAGDEGTATAGPGGVICILHWNGKRYKTKIAQIRDQDGDGELEPNMAYKLNDAGEFVLAGEGK